MKVAVTGGSGLFGRYLVRHLRDDHEVTVIDLVPPPVPGHSFVQQDILDRDGLMSALEGHDAVVHLAAIPHPLVESPSRIYQANALGTFNALEAAAVCGVKKFVFASSESTFGLVFGSPNAHPLYVPLDEDHPCRPEDPYGLSKLAAEEACKAYAERTGMAVFALRPCWIWTPEELDLVRRLIGNPGEWKMGLWAYIHVQDACRVFELALTEHTEGYDFCLVSAPDNGTREKSLDLLSKHFDISRVEVRPGFGGYDSFLSAQKAKKVLGFEARYTWKDLIQER